MSSINLRSEFSLTKERHHVIFQYTLDTYMDKVGKLDYWGCGFQFVDSSVDFGDDAHKIILQQLQEHFKYGTFLRAEIRAVLKEFNHIDF